MRRPLIAGALCLLVIGGALAATSPVTAAGANAFPSPLIGPAQYGQSSWEIVPVDVPPTSDFDLSCWAASSCLSSDDSNNAVGSSNQAIFLRTTNGGVTWEPVSTYGDGIQNISCVANGKCMVALFAGDPHLIVTIDGGTTWQPIAQPPFSPGLTAKSVACTNQFCFVIGTQASGRIPRGTLAAELSTDFGQSWHAESLPPHMTSVQAMSCAPSGTCYLVYDTSTHQFSNMARTADRGQSWKPVHKAPGFTSLGGFSCPGTRSCVYLGTQVTEVTTDGAHSWHADYGPFAHRYSPAISAFTMACSTVTQCLIGGIAGKGSNQTVDWVSAPAWHTTQLHQALVTLDADSTQSLVTDGNALGTDTGAAAVRDFNNLIALSQSSQGAIDVLALHARGNTQTRVLAIGHAWAVLFDSLRTSAGEANASKPNTVSSATVSAEVQSLLTAEKAAGGIGLPKGALGS